MRRSASSSLLLSIDPQRPESLQSQIYAGVRRAILTGTVTSGSRLPSSRELAVALRVSRTTTLLAYDQLAAEGYIASRRASGTFVARDVPGDLPPTRLAGPRRTWRQPPVSARGAALAAVPPPAVRIAGPPRAFRLGTPALDCFPVRLWSQLAHRRLRGVSVAQLDYGDPAGFLPLREAIADHVSRSRGTACTAAEVVIVPGAQRGLELVCRLLLETGDVAWLEDPGYPGARGAVLSAGARLQAVPVDDEGLDIGFGAARAGQPRLVYVTPSHQFPMGVAMSLPRRLALLTLAARAGAWIIEDDYDSEFRYGVRGVPCLHGLDGDGRVIYVGTFSKSVFPALRLGFLLVPPGVREPLIALRRTTDLHPPALDQAVLADFITGGHFERHLRRMRGIYGERLAALCAAADRWGNGALRVRPVDAGLHVIADLAGADQRAVCREAASRGVEVMPVSAYAMDGSSARASGLVLGFAAVRPDVAARGMQQLVAAIEAVRRQSMKTPPRSPRGIVART